MCKVHLISSWKVLATSIVWLLVGATFSIAPIHAQLNNPSLQYEETFQIAQSGRGRVVKRRALGSMGPSCGIINANDETLTSLVPRRDIEGLAIDSRPTVWIYVPYQASDIQAMTFRLKDSAGETIYQPTLSTPETLPGVISLRLPETVVLEIDQQYDWVFNVSCGEANLFVEGAVKRVTPSAELQNELNDAMTPQAKASVYRRYGIWYDALTIIGERRRSDGRNTALTAVWAELLESVDLSDVVSKPIVN